MAVPCVCASSGAPRVFWQVVSPSNPLRGWCRSARAGGNRSRASVASRGRRRGGAVLGSAARGGSRRRVGGRRQRRHARREADRRQDDADGGAGQLRGRQQRVHFRAGEEGRADRRADVARADRVQLRRPRARRRLHDPRRLHAVSGHQRADSGARNEDPRGEFRGNHGHVCGRRRRRRGEGGSEGDRRLPPRAGTLFRHRRPHPQGRAARRSSGNRQDAARPIDCRRGEGAVPLRQRLGLRRDVCRRRRVAHPQAVPGCAPPPDLHHLHRRARRGRPKPRRQLAQPRGARADAQSAARRDGRLRAEPGHRRDRGDEPSRHSRSGAAASGPFRSSGHGRRARREGARADPAHPYPEGRGRSGHRSAADRARHARLFRGGSREPGQRGGALRRAGRADAGRRPTISTRRATRC